MPLKSNDIEKKSFVKNIKNFRANGQKTFAFWLGALIILTIMLFIFNSILLPFVFGMVVAYFLNPVVSLLSQKGLGRVWASSLILLIFVLLLALFLMLVIPVIVSQLSQFITHLPFYIEKLHGLVLDKKSTWMKTNFGLGPEVVYQNINNILHQSAYFLSSILSSIWYSGKSLLNLISIFIVAPVIAFYLMIDWNQMVLTVDSWIPRAHLKTVRNLFHEVDRTVAGFIRGQSIVSLILGIYYIVFLGMIGLNFSFLIGILIGILSFIPYVGLIIGFLFSICLSVIQFWPTDLIYICLVVLIFAFGQFMEGYILQPKLIGSSIGLHPVWLMFSLFAFSLLFGFTGVLIAIPAAAAIGVLLRFCLRIYLNSNIYKARR